MYSHDTTATYSFSILPDCGEYLFLWMWLGMTPPTQAGTEDISSHEPSSVYDDTIEYETIDEYIENTPLEARFDVNTIRMLVEEAIPKHRAYDMSFDQYFLQRSRFSEYDESEKKRLSFYLPLYPAMRTQDFADYYSISVHKFLTTIIELGLITFLYDYHDDCNVIKTTRASMKQFLTTEYNRSYYLDIKKQTITIGSCSGSRSSDGPMHFVPSVQEWLYNAMNDVSIYMNITVTDLSYLCWCIGTTKTVDSDCIDRLTEKDNLEVMDKFNIGVTMYLEKINAVYNKLSSGTVSLGTLTN